MATKRSEQLLNDLMALVLELGPGKQLPPQDRLSEKFDSSRTLVRESLAILEFLRVIVIRPKLGTTINHSIKWLTHNQWLLDQANKSFRVHGPMPESVGAE